MGKEKDTQKDKILRQDIIRVVGALLHHTHGEALNEEDTKKNIIKSFSRFRNIDKQINLVNLPNLLINGGLIRHGGGGLVFECMDATITGRRYALKIQRPSLLALDRPMEIHEIGKSQEEARIEALRTAMLSHINVAHLIGLSQLIVPNPPGPKIPITVLLLEWIDKAEPLSDYIYQNCQTITDLINLFKQVFRGLDHIHSKELIHWDIKSANTPVTEINGNPIVKITDIGNARRLDNPEKKYSEDERVYISRENAPPEFLPDKIDEDVDTKRIQISFEKDSYSYNRPWLDLYMAGRMIGKILGYEQELNLKKMRKRHVFLERIFKKKDKNAWMANHFFWKIYKRLTIYVPYKSEKNPEDERYYFVTNQVLNDLDKILPEFGAACNIPELYSVPQKIIRIPVTRNTEHSLRIKDLIDSYPIKRLTRHLQLGLTWYVYPGTRHTRFEHVIGVLGTTINYIRALYADRTTPDFRLICDSQHIRALIFASIIHDIGHGAFSHYLEECKALFYKCTHMDYAQALLKNDPTLFKAPIKNDCFNLERQELLNIVNSGWLESKNETPETFFELVAKILQPGQWDPTTDLSLLKRKDTEIVTHYVLNSIIDGTIDADKLDYLRRDAYHGGIDYAFGADIDRFFQSLSVAINAPVENHDEKFSPTIAVTQKGVLPVESLLLARYQVFSAMYWHRTARAATILVKYLVWRYLWPPEMKADDGEFNNRRGNLLDNFRNHTDEDTLDWLRNAFKKSNNKTIIKMLPQFMKLIKILEERKDLPEPIFDISPSQLKINRKQLERVIGLHDILNELPYEKYCINMEKILKSVIKIFSRKVKSLASRKKINLGKFNIDETSLFLDVPISSKDKIKNLWVVGEEIDVSFVDRFIHQKIIDDWYEEDRDSLNNKNEKNFNDMKIPVVHFDDHSLILTMIREAFQFYARRLRIFLLPEMKNQLIEKLGKEEIEKIAFEALTRAYKKVLKPLIKIKKGKKALEEREEE